MSEKCNRGLDDFYFSVLLKWQTWETEFGRRACLDLNAEIIEIATSGEGLALYWKAAGPRVLARSDA